jgi:hypothetical protein
MKKAAVKPNRTIESALLVQKNVNKLISNNIKSLISSGIRSFLPLSKKMPRHLESLKIDILLKLKAIDSYWKRNCR